MAGQSSDSDEDWDNLGDWGAAGETPTIDGVVAPALRETAISPTASWDEDDEPWPTPGTAPALRGAGAPRAPLVSWDEGVAGGNEDDYEARLPRPPAEGVVSPTVQADRQVGETFAWAPDDTWEPGEASSTRGLGRPRSEVERLEELHRVGQDPFGDIMPAGEEWADDAQGWVVQAHQQTPPPAEGVLAPGAAARPMASTFNLGDGTEEGIEATAGRGTGIPRSEQERLGLAREEGEDDDEWARSGQGFDAEEMARQIPEVEGVLGEGPREDGAFAENFGWEGELGEEWGPQERIVPPGRGAGAPVPPAVRRQQVIAEEAMRPGGPLPAIQPGRTPMPDPSDNERGSDATPSSYNTDKQFELMKQISMRFLPDFANDENRALNIMILEAERKLREIEDATQEQDDRTTVMEDHMKRVQEEITATQQRVEAKKKEIATEEHLKTMTNFQATRLKREVGKMESEMHEMMERLENYRAAILQGNDKLEKFRQVQQWNEQELEQWVQAALQKDEDYAALESYHKYDDTRIKALRLDEQMISGDLAKIRDLLEGEMSETQSYQVALDKTAVEFRQLHAERQEVIKQWEVAIALVHKRDGEIHKLSEEFAANQQNLRKQKQILDNLDLRLYDEQNKNAKMQREIHFKNLDAKKTKDVLREEMEKLKRTREALVNIKAEHFRAQHQYAKEVARKVFFQEEIIRQKNMYQDAREKLQKMKKKVEDEYNHLDTLENRTHTLHKLLHAEELNLKLAKKEVANLQNKHFKGSENLFSLQAAEGGTIQEIKGGKSIAKTLVNRIAILEIELLRKEDKLYAADFQIHVLEGKIKQASGVRSNAEEIETEKQIKELKAELEIAKYEEHTINDQMKRSLNDMRKSSCRKEELELRNKKLNDKNAELNLECDAGMIGNKAMVQEREEVTLEADLLQMEVQRLTDLLHLKADEVYNLDLLKKRLNQNMEDRKIEVDNRQEIRHQEIKMITEELHDLKIKRQNLILKIDKLQCKYDCLRARTKSVDGVELTAEYFLNKLKSSREEIQKKGLDLNEELRKTRVDVKFLESATKQIIDSNNNLRTSLTESERTIELEEEAMKLKEELQNARDRARLKQKEEKHFLQDLAEVEEKVQNKEDECKSAIQTSETLEYRIELAQKGQEEQTTKRKRAATRLNSLMRELQEKTSPEEAKRVSGEFVLSEVRESTRDVLRKLQQLAVENPEYALAITMRVEAEGFKLPTGPGSARSGGSSNDHSVASTPAGRRSKSPPSKITGGVGAPASNVVTLEFKGPGPSSKR